MAIPWFSSARLKLRSALSPGDPGKLKGIFITVGVVCALLVALLIAALYLLRVRQKKSRCIPCFPRLSFPKGRPQEGIGATRLNH